MVSSDIITDLPLQALPKQPSGLAHLVLVDNPAFKPKGDFGLAAGYVDFNSHPYFTFANIGVYRAEFFADCTAGYFPLNKILFPAIKKGVVTGEHYAKNWYNVGSPAELHAAQTYLTQRK